MAAFRGGYKDRFELMVFAMTTTGLRLSDVQVLAYICESYNMKQRCCYPHIDKIAERLGICERQVKRAIQRLEGFDLLTAHRYARNEYVFVPNFDAVPEQIPAGA